MSARMPDPTPEWVAWLAFSLTFVGFLFFVWALGFLLFGQWPHALECTVAGLALWFPVGVLIAL